MSKAPEEEEEEVSVQLGRKEKRKVVKKQKRKQRRKELAEKAREEEPPFPDDQLLRLHIEQLVHNEIARAQFEDRERFFEEQLQRRKEEEEERRVQLLQQQKSQQNQDGHENDEDDDWEYVEEGPPEIIWKGNEIIVKKNKVRVKKKDQPSALEDITRPTSNPLPPQSDAFHEFKSGPMVSAQKLLDDVAQQVPNFGTEQDKDHCPFHLKTGACRFGSRCSRVHFYPDKSCTLLIKNMYNGPGLAWEQDEGLEQTDEEVERCYEEFYEDVHTEFLKFGVIINFKVCRNSSSHLRGNVYVQYKSLDSAIFANQSINGRYFAGKQVTCEFINVTKWKIAICGEFMKSKLKTCSRGTACNFIHCFRNPGGDYEWADWDKPPPRYWIRRMDALFGHTDESACARHVGDENLVPLWDTDRYHSKRSHSKEAESPNKSSRSYYQEQNDHDTHRSSRSGKHYTKDRILRDFHYDKYDGEETRAMGHPRGIDKFSASESDKYWSDRDADVNWYDDHTGRRLRSPEGKRKYWDREEDHKKGRHGGYSRKRPREEEDDHKESKTSVDHSTPSKEHSRKERSKDLHYSGRDSRHHHRKSVSIDDRWDGGS